MRTEFVSLIEGYRRSSYLLVFMIGLNPYTIYAILYGAPTYGESSIFPYLGDWIWEFIWILVFFCIFVAH